MAMFSGKIRLATLTVLLLNGSLFAVPDWETAAELRKNNEIDKAETTLKKYSSPAGFEQLKPAEKIEFLRGLLELAHIRALNDDVVGSLALLNWAEGRSDPYQRSIACVKYAEILLDLGEFERARGYLANADELIKTRATKKDTGAAIGQGGEKVDTGGAWRELRDESDALKADIESEEMKNKFGATYGSYVKLRRLQQVVKRARIPRYRNEAMRVADEIIATDPASQFAVAAEYLKGELMASRLTENSDKKEIRKAKDYLEKFVKAQPEGLYRGEALMLLGKISLEIEWNAKDAEKYYNQALDYFRKAREKRDALSLYAAINDDLKKQAEPTQKPTSLNEWMRTIYHDEDPLKLYNTASAPVWYIDNKEKECVYACGFLAFAAGKYDAAKECWERVKDLSPDDAQIHPLLPTTVYKRLTKACRLQAMMYWPEEKANIKNADMRLMLQHAEYLALLEKWSESAVFLEKLKKRCRTDDELAVVLVGLATVHTYWFNDPSFTYAFSCYKTVVENKKLYGTSIHGRAVKENGKLWLSVAHQQKKALPFFLQYQKMYKNGRYFREVRFMEAKCHLAAGRLDLAKQIYETLKGGSDSYEHFLLSRIKEYENDRKK